MADEKMEKFEQIAQKRVANAIHAIELIGNLGNTSAYHYTEAHVNQIFSGIDAAVENVRSKFDTTPKEKKEKPTFSFSGIAKDAPEEDPPEEEL